MKDRLYSFLVPWFYDGSLAIVQTCVPLLALSLGADSLLLGTIGFVAQGVRFPVCLTSGHLSEKLGRKLFVVPAGLALAAMAVGLAFSRSNYQVILYYTIALAAIGAFYPPLQALIGDVSRRGQLRKNLGAFNLGWCSGSAVAALAAAWLVTKGLSGAFLVAAGGAVVTAVLVVSWRGERAADAEAVDSEAAAPPNHSSLLLIARMGHFTAFFGYATVRILFPRVGKLLGWSDPEIAQVLSLLLWGQAIGIVVTSVSPWWRGKLWPQACAHTIMLLSGVAIALVSSPALLGAAFFCVGIALSVVYTAALYYGLSKRSERGRNTGIHEALVAGAQIAGSLLGGFVAQSISVRAPYIMFSCLAAACLVAGVVLTRRSE